MSDTIGKAVLNDDGSYMIQLDNKKRVQVRKFRGVTYVDIREFYKADNEYKPSKKGISLNVETWKQLKECIADIDECIKEI